MVKYLHPDSDESAAAQMRAVSGSEMVSQTNLKLILRVLANLLAALGVVVVKRCDGSQTFDKRKIAG